jgi:hypothetical protein
LSQAFVDRTGTQIEKIDFGYDFTTDHDHCSAAALGRFDASGADRSDAWYGHGWRPDLHESAA